MQRKSDETPDGGRSGPDEAGADDSLLARIESFELDDRDSPRPFSRRLGEEQRWDARRTSRAIREYKRFLFLAMTLEGGASPSEPVDAVWHLHLLYTRSYWSRLCSEVLGRPLHHDPSRGGPSERRAHDAMYARTLDAYRAAFGEEPPSDLWPQDVAPHARSKRWIHRAATTIRQGMARLPRPATAMLVALVATMPWLDLGCAGPLGPLDMTGPSFLVLYVVLLLGTFALSYVLLPNEVGAKGDVLPTIADPYELAFLAGGERRIRDVAITALVAKRALVVTRDGHYGRVGRASEPPFEPLSSVERVLLDQVPSTEAIRPFDRRLMLETTANAMRATLAERGLVYTEAERSRIYGQVTWPMLVLATVGGAKVVLGIVRDKPVGILAFIVFLTFLAVLLRGAGLARRTGLGDRVLRASVRAAHAARDDLAAIPRELPMFLALGVAIDGATNVDLGKHAITRELFLGATPDTGGGCSSGCGGGGCGGGDGGGGCGGCGGD